MKKLLQEKAFFIALIVTIVTFMIEHYILEIGSMFFIIGICILIFVTILYSSVSVSKHAEELAHKYGEPYGTMILTLSAVIVEVIIIGIMMWDGNNPNLAIDTIVSAIILDICGLLGLSALIGGLMHGVQKYNINSSNSFMAIIFIALFSAMVIPTFLPQEILANYNILLVILFFLITIIFYKIQIIDHKGFFQSTQNKSFISNPFKRHKSINSTYHITMLILSIIMIGILAEFLSVFLIPTLAFLALPMTVGAFIIAIISASPEFMTAIKAAKKDNMQTVINIAFGASTATVLLTVPIMIILSFITGIEVNLSLTPISGILLFGTIIASMIKFSDGKLNRLEGFIFLMIFVIYVFLIFSGVV